MDSLPVSTTAAARLPEGADATVSVFPRAAVLVVDDALEIRETLAAMLRLRGYEVDTAEDGLTGWKAWCKKTYRLLITDCAMPNLSGIELLRRVRDVSPGHPVILISGYATWAEADLDDVLPPGRFLAKPFQFQTLFSMVESLLLAASLGNQSIRS
jgi:DNA-binding NtrC family response regulator